MISNTNLKKVLNEIDVKNLDNTKETTVNFKKRKKKKIKQKTNIENNVYNNPNDINMFNMANSMASEGKIVYKESDKSSENRRIIDRIKMNCCCIYFWFCFSRKKKNVQNILLDEGMDIIIENLDIMNIFRKIYNMNKVEQSLKVNAIVDMSDICKLKLNDLTQSKLRKQFK